MKRGKLYDKLASLGEAVGFSVMVYSNELDSEGTGRAREVAKKFHDFAEYCEANDLTMEAELKEVPILGMCSVISIMDGATPIMLLAAPHNLIDIEGEDHGRDD